MPLPKLPAALVKNAPAHAGVLYRFWKGVQGLSIGEIEREADAPFVLALVGTPEHTSRLAERLSRESVTVDAAHAPADIAAFVKVYADTDAVPSGALTLNADDADEAALAVSLAELVKQHPDLRLSLAKHVPALRPAAVTQMVNDASWTNAKLAAASALPSVFPLGGLLLPGVAAGDMLLLTRNQVVLLLRIAAAYGLPPDLKARTRELLPVVGSAFGWRAAARELLGLLPGGVGIAVKAAVAYAGTYTVGKAAHIYYSTGRTLTGPRLRQLYKDALRDAQGKVRGLLETGRGRFPRLPRRKKVLAAPSSSPDI